MGEPYKAAGAFRVRVTFSSGRLKSECLSLLLLGVLPPKDLVNKHYTEQLGVERELYERV